MDIKDPNQKFSGELDKVLRGKSTDESRVLAEDKDLLRLAQEIKQSVPVAEPNEQFTVNLRKRLVNEYDHVLRGQESSKQKPLLQRGRVGLLARPKRRFIWAAVPLAVVALLVVFTSFALASPGFYESFVPQPVKNMLENSDVVKTGDLFITSNPAGATVYLNGREHGESPLEISNIRAGQHTVKLSKSGFDDLEQTVEVEGGATKEINFDLALVPVGSTETVVVDASDEEVAITNEQLVIFSSNGNQAALEIANSNDTIMEPLAEFSQNIRGATAAGEGSLFYIYETDDSKNIVTRLRPNGAQEALSGFTGNITTPLAVSSDGGYLAYVGITSKGGELHLVNVKTKEDDVLAPIDVDTVVTKLLGIANGEIYYVQTEVKGATVQKFATVSLVGGTVSDLSVPPNADGNSFVLSPDTNRILFRTVSGKPAVYNLVTEEVKDYDLKILGLLTWVGNSKVAIATDDGVSLIDLNTSASKNVFQSESAITSLVGNETGEKIGILDGGRKLIVYHVSSDEALEVTPTYNASNLVGFVPANLLVPEDRLYAPDSTGSKSEELSLLGELDLSPATFEEIVVAGDYAYRITDGENSLEVISLTNAQNPKLIATLPSLGYYKDINADISGNQLVAVGGRFVVYDVSDPAVPVKTYDADNGGTNVVVSGQTAFVAISDILRAYDIAGEPQLLGEVELPVTIYDLEYQAGKVYVAGGDGGYVVVNVSDPEHMELSFNKSEDFISEIALTKNHSYALVGAPGGSGEVEVFEPDTGELVNTITPAFAGGEVLGVGNKLYSHFPKVAAYNTDETGGVILLKEARESAIIKGVGVMGLAKEKLVILSQNTIFVFNVD